MRAATALATLVACAAFAAPAMGVQQPEDHDRLPDKDARTGTIAPTDAQRARVAALGATAQWTRFGTPLWLSKPTGTLGSGYSTASPVTAARQFLKENAALYRLTAADVDALEVLSQNPIGDGHAVHLRQRIGGLPTTEDGFLSIGVLDGTVISAGSSNTGDTSPPAAATLTAGEAFVRAARDLGLTATAPATLTPERGWSVFQAFEREQAVRRVVLPTYTEGNREAFEVLVSAPGDEHGPITTSSFVDARTGEVLVRRDRVNFLTNNPRWNDFPANPRTGLETSIPADPEPTTPARYDFDDTDTRQLWCWTVFGGCGRVLFNEAPDNGAQGREWDRIPADTGNGVPTFLTKGNNADSVESWASASNRGQGYRYGNPSREYFPGWTDQWNNLGCNDSSFTSPQRNDIDAALVNLFVGHNRMHDWSYHLGFTETAYNMQTFNYGRNPDPTRQNDPEQGGAQAGALTGTRNNANQSTPPDGRPGVTNMFLWQPVAATSYVPCVDGDYDMSVIGHEYTHAISNRMIGGPDAGISGREGGSMGESWSDLSAVEYLQEFSFVPVSGENPFSVGSYVTGNKASGIRNYAMNQNPDLNYADIGYDLVGPQVHADGEIWSATNYDIRQALVAKYNGAFRATNRALQAACANGRVAVARCPGNRRWAQIMYDAFLLMPSAVDMVIARDAYVAADKARFGGANAAELWTAFARRGLGEFATSRDNSGDDAEPAAQSDPQPSYESPVATNEATVRFIPKSLDGGAAPVDAELFVGAYEARATAIMDTISTYPDAAQFKPGDTAKFVPGTYQFIARAPGFGAMRFTRTFSAGSIVNLTVALPQNLASKHRGATATGDGTDLTELIDDTEDTSWQSLNVPFDDKPAADKPSVTIDLAGGVSTIRRVRASALPQVGGSGRYPALRRFQVLTCTATATVGCDQDAQFALRYTSPADAFPGKRHRPQTPTLKLRSFDIPDVAASHVQFRVADTQCTGGPEYHGEQDLDPDAPTDCRISAAADDVTAAEFQVLKSASAF